MFLSKKITEQLAIGLNRTTVVSHVHQCPRDEADAIMLRQVDAQEHGRSKKSGSLASGPTLLTSPPPVASGKPLKTTDGVVLSDEPVQQVCPSPFCWGKGSNGKLGKFVALERPDLALGAPYPLISAETFG